MGRLGLPFQPSEDRGPRTAVALLSGDMDELALLRAADLASSRLRMIVGFCWVSRERTPAQPLVRQLARRTALHEVSREEAASLLESGALDAVMLAPSLWRRAAGALWRRLGRASVYICRRGSVPPARTLCCTDSEATASALVGRVAAALPGGARGFTVIRALPPPPSWTMGMFAMYGYAWRGELEEPAYLRVPSGIRQMTIPAAPTAAISTAVSEVSPELVVLGLHAHPLPMPWRWSHPTAWRLSTELPCDVLLVPVRT